jgi:hypothetical protein
MILNSSVQTAKTKKTINHRGTETQRKHREKQNLSWFFIYVSIG